MPPPSVFYALLEGAEAVGLWYGKRWAEYLTFLATILLLPLEIYELTEKVSWFKIGALCINLAIAVYLLLAKRLFGLRGGAAHEAEVRAYDSGWPAVERLSPETFSLASAPVPAGVPRGPRARRLNSMATMSR